MAEIPGLTGIRGAAAVAVLLFHLSLTWPQLPPDSVLQPVVSALHQGWMGVDLFFVLSGFLLSLPYWRRAHGSRLSWTGFMTRRWWRIAPPYYLSLLLGLLLLGGWERALDPPRAPLQYLLFAQNLTPDTLVLYNPVVWTLAIEFQFYLLLPLLLPLFHGRWKWAAPLTLTAVSLVWRWTTYEDASGNWNVWAGFQVFPFLVHFAAGVTASRLWVEGVRARRRFLAWALGFALIGLVPLLSLVPVEGVAQSTDSHLAYLVVRPALAVAFAGLVWLVASAAAADRPLLDGVAANAAGRAAYSLYLVHVVVIVFLLERWPEANSTRPVLFSCLALAAVTAATTALYWMAERPSVQRSRRVSVLRTVHAPIAPGAAAPESVK